MERKLHFFVRLLGRRPDWPEGMTSEEEEIMGEHFNYLKDLVAEKRLVVAGPVMNPTFGLIILRVESEHEARSIMDKEPSVVKRLHNYEMQPMTLSLLMRTD